MIYGHRSDVIVVLKRLFYVFVLLQCCFVVFYSAWPLLSTFDTFFDHLNPIYAFNDYINCVLNAVKRNTNISHSLHGLLQILKHTTKTVTQEHHYFTYLF